MAAKQVEDAKALARWTEDPEYMRLLNFDPAVPRPPESFEDKKDDERDNDGRHFNFMFHTLAEDKLIGFGGMNVSWNNQSAWVYIGIGEPDYRGKGYGSDAMRLLVNYGFRELGLYRVGLGVFGYNTRAIRAYEKLGFVYEGAQRESLYREGQRYDTLSMSILRPEWDAMQQIEAIPELAKA
jgi:RimJ/RimL family protein N-acetyltransferase